MKILISLAFCLSLILVARNAGVIGVVGVCALWGVCEMRRETK